MQMLAAAVTPFGLLPVNSCTGLLCCTAAAANATWPQFLVVHPVNVSTLVHSLPRLQAAEMANGVDSTPPGTGKPGNTLPIDVQ